MSILSIADLVAILCFAGAWTVYALTVERTRHGAAGLNAMMNRFREVWVAA